MEISFEQLNGILGILARHLKEATYWPDAAEISEWLKYEGVGHVASQFHVNGLPGPAGKWLLIDLAEPRIIVCPDDAALLNEAARLQGEVPESFAELEFEDLREALLDGEPSLELFCLKQPEATK